MNKENIIVHSVASQVTDINGTAEVLRKIRETLFQVMDAITSGDITHKQLNAINKLLNKCITEIKKTGGSLVAIKDANGALSNIHDMLA
jgi:cob(I)alamin adenosyltransferase